MTDVKNDVTSFKFPLFGFSKMAFIEDGDDVTVEFSDLTFGVAFVAEEEDVTEGGATGADCADKSAAEKHRRMAWDVQRDRRRP
jgi:hypothetical protein